MIEIRPETTADHGAIDEVVAAAFGRKVEADLVARIRASPEYRPDLALVAVEGATVVGHVMISGCTLQTADGDHAIVMLSPLAVTPGHQGRGIGGALVEEVCSLARSLGEPLVILEGSPAYYPRFGFEPASDHGIEIELPDWAPPEAAQVRFLAAGHTSLRGAVIYPAAFDGLD